MGSGFVHVLPLVAVPLALVLLLFAYRRLFRVETTRRARLILAIVVAGTFVVLAGSHTAAWFAAGGLDRDGGWLGLAAELARQYLPLPIPGTYNRVFQNRNAVEAFLFASSGSCSGWWRWQGCGSCCSAGTTARTREPGTGTWRAG